MSNLPGIEPMFAILMLVCYYVPDWTVRKESPMRRGAPRRMKIGLFSRESPMRRGAPRRMKIMLFSREESWKERS
ncbi:hypothetical protein [Candidatus Hakubella thermalkaliphila]|uniref:hypothetical protein n=1 Tax=Candidatus Hakubella thermalkaliphila TaxID=2754717 RepID=UPI0015937BDC|nr:hypothetical protein [Candidatus Hakubella thermalkaliphila]